jgi:hypothetical protein
MNLKPESKSPSYLPVDWVYREVIEEQIQTGSTGICFCESEDIYTAVGKILELKKNEVYGGIHLTRFKYACENRQDYNLIRKARCRL